MNGEVCTCCWGEGGGGRGTRVRVCLLSFPFFFFSSSPQLLLELNNPLETFRFKDVDDYADDYADDV